MQEFCCFVGFLCQCIHSFAFSEMAGRGGGATAPLAPPPRSATGIWNLGEESVTLHACMRFKITQDNFSDFQAPHISDIFVYYI